MDRYNHDLGDDTDDTDDSPLFGSFSSYSPQSRKISQTRPPQLNPDTELDATKKQLFRYELERTVAQLSLGSPASSVTPPSKLADEKHRSLSSMKSNSSCTENQNRTDKSNTSATSATISSNESQLTVVKNPQMEGMSINLSTPDSSQTESEDISPQIQRKRHTHSRDKLPRFSISVDDEYMWVIQPHLHDTTILFLIHFYILHFWFISTFTLICTPFFYFTYAYISTFNDYLFSNWDIYRVIISCNNIWYQIVRDIRIHHVYSWVLGILQASCNNNSITCRLDLAAANKDAAEDSKHNSSTDSFESFSTVSMLPSTRQKSRSVIKSASTSGLSLVIPTSDFSCMYSLKNAAWNLLIHGIHMHIFRWRIVECSTYRVTRWVLNCVLEGHFSLSWVESSGE